MAKAPAQEQNKDYIFYRERAKLYSGLGESLTALKKAWVEGEKDVKSLSQDAATIWTGITQELDKPGHAAHFKEDFPLYKIDEYVQALANEASSEGGFPAIRREMGWALRKGRDRLARFFFPGRGDLEKARELLRKLVEKEQSVLGTQDVLAQARFGRFTKAVALLKSRDWARMGQPAAGLKESGDKHDPLSPIYQKMAKASRRRGPKLRWLLPGVALVAVVAVAFWFFFLREEPPLALVSPKMKEVVGTLEPTLEIRYSKARWPGDIRPTLAIELWVCRSGPAKSWQGRGIENKPGQLSIQVRAQGGEANPFVYPLQWGTAYCWRAGPVSENGSEKLEWTKGFEFSTASSPTPTPTPRPDVSEQRG